MECPVCGEKLPLNAKVCAGCGEPVDRFFLTEELEASQVRKSAMEIPKSEAGRRRSKRGRKGRKKIFGRG